MFLLHLSFSCVNFVKSTIRFETMFEQLKTMKYITVEVYQNFYPYLRFLETYQKLAIEEARVGTSTIYFANASLCNAPIKN